MVTHFKAPKFIKKKKKGRLIVFCVVCELECGFLPQGGRIYLTVGAFTVPLSLSYCPTVY